MKKRIAIAISVAIFAAAGTVYAATGPVLSRLNTAAQESFLAGGGVEGVIPFARRVMARVAEHLNLTQAQQSEIKTIIASERQEVEPLFRQLAATRQQMRDATKDGNFDESQVRCSHLSLRLRQTYGSILSSRPDDDRRARP